MFCGIAGYADDVVVDGLAYALDETSNTAQVVRSANYNPDAVVIPESITVGEVTYSVTGIGGSAFYNCSNLTSIELPNTITEIGGSAFGDCSSLVSIELPNTLISIGAFAFCGCTSLTKIDIPNSVTSMGDLAFYDCTGLYELNIGSGIKSVSGLFYKNTSLRTINIDPSNPVLSSVNGVVFSKDKTELIEYPDGRNDSYTIPDHVTKIGESMGMKTKRASV